MHSRLVIAVAMLGGACYAADYDSTLMDLALDNAAAYMHAAAQPLMVLKELYAHDFFEHRNVSMASTTLSSKRDSRPNKDYNDTRLVGALRVTNLPPYSSQRFSL